MKRKTTLRGLLSGCALISSAFVSAQTCPPPTGVSASPVSVCLGSPVTLSATIPSGTTTINWYTVASGGTAVATTTSASITFTPTVAGTYTFYAEAASGSSGSGTPQIFSYTGAVQSVTLQPGTYTLECWGANGGNANNGTGGAGGYSAGQITVATPTTYYIYVGGKGVATSTSTAGGWNGGGAMNGTHSTGNNGGTGGGGTDIRTTSNTTYANRIIVAGGGGGATGYNSWTGNGGAGGGSSGAAGTSSRAAGYIGQGGTQTAGGAFASSSLTNYCTSGGFGVGGDYTTTGTLGGNAGGGGYYGGGASSWGGGAGGGSGYIGGVTSGITVQTGQTGFVANPDATGNGYARITPSSSGCASTRVATAVVTVNALPTVAITPATAAICSGSSIGLTASGASSYSWSPATGLSATVGNAVTASPTTTTTYTVTGTSASNCTATTTRIVTVSTAPVAGTLSGTQTICAGSTTTFSISGNSATGTWSSGSTGVATVSSSGVVTGVSAGTDTITYTVAGTGACSNATVTRTVTVAAAPVAGTLSGTQTVCVGSTTNFSASGNSAVGTWSSGSTGVATVSSSGVVTGVSPGTAVITYTVTGTGGCSDAIATRTVTVAAAPVAGALSGAQTICAGSTTTFSVSGNSSTGTWSSGSTGVATVSSTGEVTGVSAGIATIAYTVTGTGGCVDVTATRTVAINPTPGATATAGGALAFCAGGNVVLTGSSSLSSGAAYQWLRADVVIPGATNPTYTASTSGAYTLRVFNTITGCADTSSPAINVTVSTQPSATVTLTGNLTFCQGGSVRFQAATGTGYTYQWYKDGVAIPFATTSFYTATTAGAYYVVITNGACTTTTTARTVVVNPLPAAAITANGPTAFCTGGSVTLDGNLTSGLTYQWRLNGVNITGATAATYTAAQSGAYSLVVTNANTCTATSNTIFVNVSTMPVPAITTSGAPSFCQGNSITLAATAGPGYTYQWQLNGTPVAGATGATYAAGVSGSYTVVITNGACMATSAPFAVNVTPAPPAVITPAGPTAFCQGGSVTLNANRGIGYTYQWTLNNTDIPGATGYQHTAFTSGNYGVKISDGTCPGTAAGVGVTANPFPTAVITVTGGVNMTTDVYAAYQWYRNGVLIPGATSQSYTATSDGYYAVVVTDGAGCTATSAVQRIAALNVQGVGMEAVTKIYPNPADGMVYVEANTAVDLSVLSIDGRVLLTEKNAKGIEIGSLPQGVYLIRVADHKSGRILSQTKLVRK